MRLAPTVVTPGSVTPVAAAVFLRANRPNTSSRAWSPHLLHQHTLHQTYCTNELSALVLLSMRVAPQPIRAARAMEHASRSQHCWRPEFHGGGAGVPCAPVGLSRRQRALTAPGLFCP